MAPFLTPKPILSGFKEKIDSLTTHGDRLYLGTSTGNLHIYGVDNSEEDEVLSLVEVKKGLTRRSIEQLGFIKDINSLVVLSESTVTLFPLPTFSPPTVLNNAKTAFSFAIHSMVRHVLPDGSLEQSSDSFFKPKAIPTLFTRLVVGCQRRVVIYSWKDGDAQEVKEYPLPHSPRIISFMDDDHACFAYPANEYAIFSFDKLTCTDVSMPLPTAGAASTMGKLSGLTGYMALGLGAKAKSGVAHLNDNDTLVLRDNEGVIIGKDAKPAKSTTVSWPAPPEEIGVSSFSRSISLSLSLSCTETCRLAFLKPYLFSILPAGTFSPTTTIQIRSSISLLPIQTFSYPFDQNEGSATPAVPQSNATIRLLTASQASKSLLYFTTTPLDRTAAANEGSKIWQLWMKPWSEQISELVQSGQYADALKFLDTVDQAVLPDRDKRRTLVRALNAVAQFKAGQFDFAIDEFVDLNMNPAKVVALYPESIAGRLSVPSSNWITLFGGPAQTTSSADDGASMGSSGDEAKEKSAVEQEANTSQDGSKSGHERSVTASSSTTETGLLESLSMQGGTGTLRGRLKNQLGAYLGGVVAKEAKDDDTASIRSARASRPRSTVIDVHSDLNRSVESLTRFLADRRPKLAGALAAVGITPANQAHEIAPLSETSVEDLFAIPSAALSALTPEQLLRYAQIVDTAFFKSFLMIRPSLAGSLFRIANWCEVEEVEEILRERRMFSELKDLYHQKKMHGKALKLLRQIGEKEDDMELRLDDTIQYLKKLDPEYLDQIFEYARWVFDQDSTMALEIFKSEDVELPRQAVADYLENINPSLCARYLEHLIEEKGEVSTAFHDRLAELYAKMTLSAKKRGDERSRQDLYAKLLTFIDTTHYYRVDRLYGLLSSEELYEARAILLGRMGRHDQALELYVYRLHEYMKAEEYCKRYYQAGTPTGNVFLTLLRIYLRPTAKTSSDLLQPALDLISRHSPRLDTIEALQLLPPLVTTQDIRTFLIEGLRIPVFETHVMRQISKARNDQMSRRLMALQTRRVKVTDSRICPQCHKRIGNSVIAVHSPRGEVTHHYCREAFSRKLNQTKH
ncbi:rab guanyl-nucleotide exchange factor [Moniliophthora roreri MCA 2997]|uniref:Rab guanyl-nucleotide exchange factor n=1 Tax=Moniliophthora roreri (strain MCA 2997) TaxID=1381753 RepID=V2XQ47_MONRO|nr:rab guanyl-nucleotide exchange factor [Moniliophthora roreri MCA 2997]